MTRAGFRWANAEWEFEFRRGPESPRRQPASLAARSANSVAQIPPPRRPSRILCSWNKKYTDRFRGREGPATHKDDYLLHEESARSGI